MALLLALTSCGDGATADDADTPTSTPTPDATSTPTPDATFSRPTAVVITPEVEAKADAVLIAIYRAATATPRDDAALEALDRQVDLEISPTDVRVAILAKTSLDDAELADAGVSVTTRVGEIVSGSLVVTRLPELAALPDVQTIEAARELNRS